MEAKLDSFDEQKKSDIILSMRYMRVTRFLLSTMCAWPRKEARDWRSFYQYYLPAQEFVLLCGCVYFICVSELDILAFGHDVLVVLLTLMTLVRLLCFCFKDYMKILEEFLTKFHLLYFKHKGAHFAEVYEIIEKASVYLSNYTCVIMVIGTAMFNVSPFYNNITRGAYSRNPPANITYDFTVFFAFPFFDPFEHFKKVTLINLYFSHNCAVAICVVDLLLSLIVFHIIGHIIILRKSLEKIEAPKKSKRVETSRESCEIRTWAVYSKLENEKFAIFIEEFVEHHRFITSFTERLSRFFGPVLAFNYTFHLASLCVLLLESTQGDLNAFVRYGPLTLIIFGQLIQISVIFEIVGTVSEKLPDALYSIPWESLNLRNQRTVAILLHRLQRPIHVTAMGMTTVGVTTMAGILKTTFSYFAMLRSFNE